MLGVTSVKAHRLEQLEAVMSHFGHNITGGGNLAKTLRVKTLASLIAVCAFSLSSTAYAQSKPAETTLNSALPPSEGLALNVTPSTPQFDSAGSDFVGFSSSLQGAIIDIPTESVGSRLFNLDVTDTACVTGETTCLRRSDETLDLAYSKSITTKLDKRLDIQLTPRASVSFDDESSSALVGALVRIGDDLREDSDLKSNTWYMFAGADAEAVTYSPNSVRRMTSGEFHLQDRIIVGDAQAGVGYRIGDADVSLGYFRREVTSFGREINSGSSSFKEDAAALSFTWRR